MIYVTSDLHGCPLEQLQTLLRKADFSDDDFLFILGDVIDRGEHGVELLKWLMLQPNIELILGNHEAMMLSCKFLFEEVTDESIDALTAENMHLLHIWQRNGADATIKALAKESPDTRAEILDYLSDAPLYDTVSIDEQDFVLTHAGLGNYQKDKKLSQYTPHDLLWTRPAPDDIYSEDFITIIGHTPTGYYAHEHKGKIFKTATWWDIDAGAAGGLPPMLLRLNDLQEFYLDDEPASEQIEN